MALKVLKIFDFRTAKLEKCYQLVEYVERKSVHEIKEEVVPPYRTSGSVAILLE